MMPKELFADNEILSFADSFNIFWLFLVRVVRNIICELPR